MSEEPLIKSDSNNGITLLIAICGGLFFVTISVKLLCIAFSTRYPDVLIFIISVASCLPSVIVISTIFNLDEVSIYADRLEAKSYVLRTVKTISFNSIAGWHEFKRAGKHGSWLELNLYTAGYKYVISSDHFKNYDAIKALLTANKPLVAEPPTPVGLLINSYGWMMALAVGLFFVFAAVNYQVYYGQRMAQGYSTYTGKLVSNAYVSSYKGNYRFHLRFVDAPQLDCNLGESYVPKNGQTYLADILGTGTEVGVILSTDDMLKKLTQQKPLSFWDKAFDYDNVPIYAIVYNYRVIGIESPQTELHPSKMGNGTVLLVFAAITFLLIAFVVGMDKKLSADEKRKKAAGL